MTALCTLSGESSPGKTTSSNLKITRYSSADQVPENLWDTLAPRKAVGLELAHLRAVETSGINQHRPWYFLATRGETPVGLAYAVEITVDLARMMATYPEEVLQTLEVWKPGFLHIKLLEVGHLASLGSTIWAQESEKAAFLDQLQGQLEVLAQEEGVDLCLIRDIPPGELGDFQGFLNQGFRPAKGFPLARMNLPWGSFEGYLGALKSKKRHAIGQKQKKLLSPEIRVEILEDYGPHSERLAELWTNVARENNGYQHERLTPEFFRCLNQQLQGRSHVIAIKRRGEIVAFGLNLVGDEEYFGMAEGMDYAFRDQYELYANNMFLALSTACTLGKKVLNLGITTYDFKKSLGAEVEPLVYLVKAMKNPSFTPVYQDFFKQLVTEVPREHRAFRREETPPKLAREEELQQRETKQEKEPSTDPFAKHERYLRTDTARLADLYSYYPVFESAQGPVIRQEGRDVIMLGTNSYLGLSTHPRVLEAMHLAIDRYGSGCSGSPLLNGTLDIHAGLERDLAHFLGKEEVILFSTGYQTNVGALSALVGRHDLVLMDRRNHASLVDGARLSDARILRYEHLDLQGLEKLLKDHAHQPKLLVTDSLFSMEGTVINLPEMVGLAKKYGARLMLDESHALGVYGPGGRGVADHYGLMDQVDVIMGTFSKSLASVGGFLAGKAKLMDTLRHTARAHVFSASLPPSAVAAVSAALKILESEPQRRRQLLENAAYLRQGLKDLGFTVGGQDSPIIPVFCGHEVLALGAFQQLFHQGVFVNPVTSPAVPAQEALLRVSVMATHTVDILDRALKIFAGIRTSHWPAPPRSYF